MKDWLKIHLTAPVINALGKRKEKRHFHKAPILIGGCGRSGTTLLLSIVSAHPKIFAFSSETDAFTAWRKNGETCRPLRIDRLYRKLLRKQISPQTHRWCEKRPYNVHHIKNILSYFGPEARFIHMIRDPRAVCTSEHPHRPGHYWVEPERWEQDVAAGLAFESHPQVFTLRYEDLIANQQDVIRKLCLFLNEEACPEILDWYHHATVRSNRAWRGKIMPAHDASLEKWKEPRHARRVANVVSRPAVRNLMERLGYT